ncbi:hypothetical protein FGG08_005591 [Glutinoglossum americanum]|uniref:BHLH domain-containing protein n=1 Tax=Glutinoglossum americanum TaxID=1670608 RepID=A0A9P8I6Z1_9PEZI|nr:hypothetical protein FGG08_005591 [Glutinoglossum americanum]
MAGTGSPPPFIKNEPDDHNYNPHNAQRYQPNHQQGYNISQQQPFNQYGSSQGGSGSIDPSELTVQGPLPAQNGSFGLHSYPSFGSQQNLGGFMTNSGIPDEELLDLGNLDEPHQGGFQGNQVGFGGASSLNQDYGSLQDVFSGQESGGLSMNHHGHMNQVYSHTPDGAPIQSPYIQGGFNQENFRQMQQQRGHGYPLETPSSYNVSPGLHSGSADVHSGSFENNYINTKVKSKMSLDRKGSHSNSKSPMTPKTPALGVGGLSLGTPESGSLPSQPIHNHHLGQHRHQKSLSNQWDSNPGSVHSYVDSPLSSPGHQSTQLQISEILKSGKHASLPAKVENGHHGPVPAFQTQEAKRRRRRESHNMVERRRRDNINERIQELSHLVPHHRLEDEKVRKHLVNNSPLSPTIGSTGMSPPQATSLLAGGTGRRATGNITTGIPPEEKDKGPNKGDILNGAVGWTRDLMWALHVKIQQENELADLIASLGGTFPFEQTEEEKRMRTELVDAIEKNGPHNFSYSRGPGSGLRVPKHTDLAGNTSGQSTLSPQDMSPGGNNSGSSNNNGGNSNNGGNGTTNGVQGQGQGQFWTGQHNGGSGHGSVFKEEDEYGMDMS